MFSLKNKFDISLKELMTKNPYKEYRVLIFCKDFLNSIEKKISSLNGTVLFKIDTLNILCVILNHKGINRIVEYPEVKFIMLDDFLTVCAGSSIVTANKVRTLSKCNLSGNNIGIALIDSGVYPHKDLTEPKNKISYFYDTINNLKYPYDDNGHGTFISGILCGSGRASNGLYKGIAQNSHLCCIKAFDSLGRGYISNILFSLQKILEISDDYNIRILCLPFEYLGYNSFVLSQFDILFKKALEKNIIPIVPSGSLDNNISSIRGIATLNSCITVAGIDTSQTFKPYKYSSSGPYKKDNKPNICSACVNIVSLNSDKNFISEKNDRKIYPPKLKKSYTTLSGTSISCAYISSLVALLLEKDPTLSFNDIKSLLKLSCDDLDLPKDIQGEGFVTFDKLIN